MPKRSRPSNHDRYLQLETRSMLAGGVFVDISGPNLIVVGNHEDNVFSIDLTANTAEELVQGQSETSVRFSEAFDGGIDFAFTGDVRVYTNAGNDVVTIFGHGFSTAGDLTVSMGHGDDSLYVIGGEFQDDVQIYAGTNHDSILLSDITIGDNLYTVADAGMDVMAFHDIRVGDQSRVLGQFGHDSILVDGSDFGAEVFVELGDGADCYESVQSTHESTISVRGRQGFDTVTLDESNSFSITPNVQTTEVQLDEALSTDRASAAFDQLKSDFFEYGSELPSTIGNAIQDGMNELTMSYGVDLISLDLDPASQTVSVADPTPTVSVLWDRAVQDAVEATGPGPTIASRAYAMLHTAMYDAWSAYDETAVSTTVGDTLQRPAAENTEANKIEAMSFAAFHVLDDLFSDQTDLFEDVMDQLGFDSSNTSTDTSTAAGLGNRMASELLMVRHEDGSNQLGDSPSGTDGVAYSDTTGYVASNPVGDPTHIDVWTPEYVPVDALPGTEDRIQEFLTPHWGTVEPFALNSSDEFLPAAPQPFLLVDGTVDLDAKTITLSDDTVLNIDKSLVGSVINPEFISQAEHVVDVSASLTDEQKLIAEFWEDGGGTSFPPGTFMTFGEFVSARDNNSIDDDAKLFLALGNAVFDAGIATWESKVVYDYTRPVRAIRELGELGLIGEFDADLGGYAIEAWTPENGTQTILATDFLTYQTPGSDVSPPFAEYTSGHSAFSAAGAEILELFTGSDAFNASVTFETGESRFEPGTTPSSSVTLSWDTFSAAADEAGLSRIYGGIHFTEGDVNGRTLGEQVGQSVWAQAQSYINGTM